MENEVKDTMKYRTDRLEALQQHLNLKWEDMGEVEDLQYEENGFAYGKEEYLVLTEEEADKRAKEDIERDLWAFEAGFILQHCSTYDEMTNYEYGEAKEALLKIQSHFGESINALIKAMIKDLDEFVEDAIIEYGRGHFISHYDGYEDEYQVNGMTFFVYRLN